MKKTILFALVLVLGLVTEFAKADFTFGTPVNLGPTINSSLRDFGPTSSADSLSLYFDCERPGGYGDKDLWVTTRPTTEKPWGEPVNLGSTVNSSYADVAPSITADGLSLFFVSRRPGGFGERDIWVTTRNTISDPWGEPVNLGPPINTSYRESGVCISADRLELYFSSDRPGGSGGADLWVATRSTVEDDWVTPVNLGSTLNTSFNDGAPNISTGGLCLFLQLYGSVDGFDIWMSTRPNKEHPWGIPVNLGLTVNSSVPDLGPEISSDGSTLYFCSNRPGGFGHHDIWQASIEPVVDLNGDGIVDCADMCIIVDHWGTDEPMCDIGPTPLGDGIVDVQDLIVLAEHLFEGIPPVELEDVNVDEDDDGSQVELEQGQILVVTLESNPTTGYGWEVAEIQESILEQLGEAEFKPSEEGEPPIIGAGGWEIFSFEAISAGQTTLQLVYRRPWEEGVEPINTFSIEVVVK